MEKADEKQRPCIEIGEKAEDKESWRMKTKSTTVTQESKEENIEATPRKQSQSIKHGKIKSSDMKIIRW